MKPRTKQADLARAIGVSQSHFSQVMHGDRGFSWKINKRIAKVLQDDFPGLTPAFLMDATPTQLKRIFKIKKLRKK